LCQRCLAERWLSNTRRTTLLHSRGFDPCSLLMLKRAEVDVVAARHTNAIEEAKVRFYYKIIL
jgi:hypothetical protein